ncbi:SDR family oxidoreductase [Nocardioides albidus]|uniref:SDR family oxidoreductase n=1 Tax=Nocardioides albidus TaxID=1517589 RepID=A0A5C4VKY2_9ACTN|nr:SDR family oxidoreductase [Nocardioides albidus]TNM36503.1 SDR family oxidoreductase [Nocardioides albidus]
MNASPQSAVAGQGIVVTGAARGIGRALAARLVAEGARVVINDLDPASTEATAAEIGAHAVPGDGASEEGVAALVAAAGEHLGTIDAWFANAGVVRGTDLEASEEEWATSWEVNTMAHVRAARLLVPGWLERGRGRFVVTASAAGLLTALGTATYSVTKHGAVAFAEWLSATYRHRGLVVQAICPQGVQTDMLARDGAMRDILVSDGALTPDDVAEAMWQGLQDDRFLILPHPQVADYYRSRAQDTDRWLGGMNRLQRLIESDAGGPG